jgi:hypothetical protein
MDSQRRQKDTARKNQLFSCLISLYSKIAMLLTWSCQAGLRSSLLVLHKRQYTFLVVHTPRLSQVLKMTVTNTQKPSDEIRRYHIPQL